MQRVEKLSEISPALDYTEWDSLTDVYPVDENGLRTEDYEGSDFGKQELKEEEKFDRLVEKLDRAADEGRMSKEHVENLKARQLERSIGEIEHARRGFRGENLRYQAWLKEHDEENQENLKRTGRIEVEEVPTVDDKPRKIEIIEDQSVEAEPVNEVVENTVNQTKNLELHPDVQAWLNEQIRAFTEKVTAEALEKQRQYEGQKLASVLGAVAMGKTAQNVAEKDQAIANEQEETLAKEHEEAMAKEREEALAKEREEALAKEREEALAKEREEAEKRERLIEEILDNQAEIESLKAKIEALNAEIRDRKIAKLKQEIALKEKELNATNATIEDIKNGKKPRIGLLSWIAGKINKNKQAVTANEEDGREGSSTYEGNEQTKDEWEIEKESYQTLEKSLKQNKDRVYYNANSRDTATGSVIENAEYQMSKWASSSFSKEDKKFLTMRGPVTEKNSQEIADWYNNLSSDRKLQVERGLNGLLPENSPINLFTVRRWLEMQKNVS